MGLGGISRNVAGVIEGAFLEGAKASVTSRVAARAATGGTNGLFWSADTGDFQPVRYRFRCVSFAWISRAQWCIVVQIQQRASR